MSAYADQLQTVEHLNHALEWALQCPDTGSRHEMVRVIVDEMCAVLGGVVYAASNEAEPH